MQTKFNYVKPSECNIDYHNLINYAKRLAHIPEPPIGIPQGSGRINVSSENPSSLRNFSLR
jgi:hypothetical protein